MDADEAVQAIEQMEAGAQKLVDGGFYTIEGLLENLRDILEAECG